MRVYYFIKLLCKRNRCKVPRNAWSTLSSREASVIATVAVSERSWVSCCHSNSSPGVLSCSPSLPRSSLNTCQELNWPFVSRCKWGAGSGVLGPRREHVPAGTALASFLPFCSVSPSTSPPAQVCTFSTSTDEKDKALRRTLRCPGSRRDLVGKLDWTTSPEFQQLIGPPSSTQMPRTEPWASLGIFVCTLGESACLGLHRLCRYHAPTRSILPASRGLSRQHRAPEASGEVLASGRRTYDSLSQAGACDQG